MKTEALHKHEMEFGKYTFIDEDSLLKPFAFTKCNAML